MSNTLDVNVVIEIKTDSISDDTFKEVTMYWSRDSLLDTDKITYMIKRYYDVHVREGYLKLDNRCLHESIKYKTYNDVPEEYRCNLNPA